MKVRNSSRVRARLVATFFLAAIVLGISLLGLSRRLGETQQPAPDSVQTAALRTQPVQLASSPPINDDSSSDVIRRDFVLSGERSAAGQPSPRTIFTHTVQAGDTVFGLADAYGLLPETLVWSNFDELGENPNLLRIGQHVLIPPVDGLIFTVETGDTIDGIARRFEARVEDIVSHLENGLSSVDQPLSQGQRLFVPQGSRGEVTWALPQLIEVATNPATGVRTYRTGSCGVVSVPALGIGNFLSPTRSRVLSGYNYGPTHGGLDLDGTWDTPLYAADSGTIVFAGDSVNSAGKFVGYGRYIVIDHGNGFQTLYAHNNQNLVSCGQQVQRGQLLAYMGSTGKSTGPHIHFEIRQGQIAVNPWDLLVE